VGKTTIIHEALQRTGADFSVSATTRKRRPDETHGRDYLFVERSVFESMVDAGEMLEWAEVHGELYGTPGSAIAESLLAGKTIVLDVDVQGAVQLNERLPDATYILILPPDEEILEKRLRDRGTESDEKIIRRLAKAKEEVRAAKDSGIFGSFVINDDLQTAVMEIVTVIDKMV